MLTKSRENDYNCNPQKRFKLEEEDLDYTFIMPQEKIFVELKDQNIFRTPKPYNVSNHLKERSQYCIFHEDYGHTLAACKNLYYQLRAMMKRGDMQKYVKRKTPMKPTMPPSWANRGKEKVDHEGTSKDKGKLNVVSFIQQKKDEKLGRYENFEGRRIERGSKTMSMK